MRKIFIYLILLIVVSVARAQSYLPDNDFENWTPFTSTSGNITYHEPSSGWWGTLNRLSFILLGNPITVTNTNDAYSGQYAAKLETKQAVGMVIPGLMYAGYFDPNSPLTGYIVQGRPFDGKPEKLSGWCKNIQSGSDSSGILIYLTRFNTATQSRDTIGREEKAFYSTEDSYTYFEQEFEYFQPDEVPDSIFILVISSLGWKNFGNATVGNTLFVDDLTLHYSSGVTENMQSENPVVSYNDLKKTVLITCSEITSDFYFEMFSLNGSKLFSRNFSGKYNYEFSPGDLPTGIHIFRIINDIGISHSGKIFIP